MANYQCPKCYQRYVIDTPAKQAALRTHLTNHAKKFDLGDQWIEDEMAKASD